MAAVRVRTAAKISSMIDLIPVVELGCRTMPWRANISHGLEADRSSSPSYVLAGCHFMLT